MKTQFVLEAFLKSKRRHVKSISRYQTVFKSFLAKFPEMPTTGIEINEWLSEVKGSDSNLYVHYGTMRAVYKFAQEQLDFPDAFKKLHPPEVSKKQRRIWTSEELAQIINSAKPGRDRILLLVLFDSTCRIGDIGKHELTPGTFYPGLNVSNLNHNSFTCTSKTGERKYRCQPVLINAMKDIADQDGFIFTTSTGQVMTSHYLAKHVALICKQAGITGKKIGAHTFRHTAGTLVAKHTRSALAVKALLQHDKIDTSMIYIHNAEEDIQQEISPLEIAGELIKEEEAKAQQLLLPSGEQTTTIVPADQVEVVEGIPDLTDQLFPEIPPDVEIRPRLATESLTLLRKACVYYCQNASIPGETAKYSRMFKMFLKNSPK
jgi:integrase